ncbi:MAG TPA: hypothetical protein VFX33_12955, partial [Actinomycetales bacterium]|nr:hypothetical protein [Actinomycetales bacterium]
MLPSVGSAGATGATRRRTVIRKTAALTRGTVAASLAMCGVLTVAAVVLMPDFSGGEVEWLQAIADAPTAATASAMLFVASQLTFAVGLA